MSRFIGREGSGPLSEAGQIWLSKALLANGSVLSDRPLWTLDNVRALENYFSNNPDTGEGDFFDKLETQLEPCAPEVKQLAAEMLWLMLLCVSNIGADKKRSSVARVETVN
jgi:5-methylcytosine-specific restriction protein B